jgi:DNA-binding MarR family transcriptional regulator
MSPRNPIVPLDPGTADLHGLLSYRLSVVANLLSRTQMQRLGPASGLLQHEWRALVLVNSYGPLPLSKLARHAGLDLGQTSRIVAKLVDAGYIARNPGADARSSDLVLTPAGRALHRKLWRIAMQCNDELLAALTPRQHEVLLSVLDTLAGAAQAALDSADDGAARRA